MTELKRKVENYGGDVDDCTAAPPQTCAELRDRLRRVLNDPQLPVIEMPLVNQTIRGWFYSV